MHRTPFVDFLALFGTNRRTSADIALHTVDLLALFAVKAVGLLLPWSVKILGMTIAGESEVPTVRQLKE